MMKKHLIVFVLAVALAAGITYLIFVFQKRSEFARLARLTHIPHSEQHQHVSPDGKVVSHTHIYDSPELLPSPEVSEAENDISTDSDMKDYMKTNSIQRIWAALDMDEIRAEFQPYTLEEIHEKWSNWFSGRHHWSAIELDKLRPREELIARLYDYGFPFIRANNYKSALSTRFGIKDYLDRADTIPPHERVALPAEATWEEIEETFLKRKVLAALAFERAYQADPDNFLGGVYTINDVDQGVLTPFKENTVYVYVSEDKPISQFTGAKLTAAEEAALTMFGVAPEGMQVIYTDKNGIPLPADQKPRYYERAMAGLDAAETHVAKLIADHDALFQEGKGVAVPTLEGAAAVSPQESTHFHPHPEESSRQKPQKPEMPSLPPQVLENMLPPDIPGDPRDPAQMQKWFSELLLLHGGDLPKDVKALQEAIKFLSEIRERGESGPSKPPERSVPQPPSKK